MHAELALREIARGERSLDEIFRVLRAESHPWLLESSRTGGFGGRWSFAGADPWAVLRARGRALSLEVRRAVRADWEIGTHSFDGDAIDVLRALLGPCPDPASLAIVDDAPPLLAGAVGWLGHELVATLERVAVSPESDADLPDVAMLLVDRVVALDHTRGVLYAAGTGFGTTRPEAHAHADNACAVAAGWWQCAAKSLAGEVPFEDARAPSHRLRAAESEEVAYSTFAATGERTSSGADALPPVPRASSDADALPPCHRAAFDATTYGKLVTQIKEHIAAGDLYQACLTHRIEAPAVDAWTLYAALREESPAPFAAFLALPEATLVSSSPERFLRVTQDGVVESRPIKGTRPRGRTPREDAQLRSALATSAKDRAENVMIVDLVRNDLGRVCETGSVAVPALCEIETHATVFQLVSTVTGRLSRDRDALDAVRAAFPPGSMTGAPKLAAINLLARLEPARRGPYGGALGWIDSRGALDLAVVIRSAFVRRDRVWFHSGGGVVADSEPLAEWRETLDKARAFFRAYARTASRDSAHGR